MDVRALSQVTVLGVDGATVRLGSVWSDRPAVVVWLRHFGCLFCREQAADMRARRADIEAMGGRLVFVGNGGVRFAAGFQKEFAPDVTVLTDPELRSYRAVGARHGVLNTVGPRAWAAGIRALRSGARQTRVKGHPFQQGAVMVLAPGDRLVYSHISRVAGDHPPADQVVGALAAATQRRAAGF
ncbi:MAG: AhpC/TSA family protein [Candidatus Dormibacteraeota bacterium]|nr:AhpC/TSA family protein [Candidatus Dormibacteraeota bacterium]MBV9525218.1 AhpC/TSA family protein [Candidatus Dormibacteraeota bacterium]